MIDQVTAKLKQGLIELAKIKGGANKATTSDVRELTLRVLQEEHMTKQRWGNVFKEVIGLALGIGLGYTLTSALIYAFYSADTGHHIPLDTYKVLDTAIYDDSLEDLQDFNLIGQGEDGFFQAISADPEPLALEEFGDLAGLQYDIVLGLN